MQCFTNCALSLAILSLTLSFNPACSAGSLYKVRAPRYSPKVSAIQRNWLLPSAFPLSAIEDGRQWVGYYTEPPEGGHLRLSLRSPMYLTFSRNVTEECSGDEILFSASGSDSVGSFRISGTITCKMGHVSATKKYNNAHSWDYHGVVLPWALVGVWGRGQFNSWGGWWWLWPKDEL